MKIREEDIAAFYGLGVVSLRRYKNGSKDITIPDDKLLRRYKALKEGYIKFISEEKKL